MLEEHAPVPALDETAPPHAEAWGWREIAATLAITVGSALALGLLARGLVAATGISLGQSLVSPALYLVGVGIYLAAIAGVYLFAARRAGWGALGLRAAPWRAFALVVPAFILLIAGLIGANLLVASLVGQFENPQVEAITGGQALGTTELLMLLALVAGLVPFAEELFFRGMVYPVMRRRLGAPAAIVLNAAFFSAAHVVPVLLPGLFVAGLLLAFLRERSGSIWPSVCLHALQNGLALISIAAALGSGAI